MSVTDDNLSDLVEPLASQSVRETDAVAGEADVVELLPDERLLNGEVYFSVKAVTKKRQRTFWGFRHGEEIVRKHDKITCWLCGFCNAVDVIKIFSATSTVWIGDHLIKKHQQQKPLSNEYAPPTSTLIRGSAFSPVTPEQLGLFKLKLITWMIKNHISYSQVEDDDFREFVGSYSLGEVRAQALLPRSGNTIRSWILDEYHRRKEYLCEKVLGTASSVVHISFDLWTAPNNSAYLDVIAHFLDAKKELRAVVLAVRNIHGDHSGKNQAKAILPVIDEYALKEKLGYFMTDSASSNDTCVAEIIDLIRPDLDPGERRLRCMGHIINLIAKAFIFGNKSETFEADIAVAENTNDLEAAMKLWRKQGAIGKLHNLIRFIRASSQREAMFMDIAESFPSQADELDNGNCHLTIIDDNRTRWNSTYLAIQRALRLRRRIEKFYSTRFNKEKDFPSSDILSDSDWDELAIFQRLLYPFYRLSMRLQGNSKTGTHGAVWESLVCIDIIKEHLKKAKTEHVRDRNSGFLATAINSALTLAQKYFKLISETPVYSAALLLNPTQKWEYFDSKWQDNEKQVQAQEYRKVLQDIWLKQYKKDSSSSQPRDIIDEFLAPILNYEPESSPTIDEFKHYCQGPTTSLHSGRPVLEWWISNEAKYPELTKWAYDMHSIPAMSAECERVFSSAGHLLTKQRNRLLDDIVEANECLLAWRRAELF